MFWCPGNIKFGIFSSEKAHNFEEWAINCHSRSLVVCFKVKTAQVRGPVSVGAVGAAAPTVFVEE